MDEGLPHPPERYGIMASMAVCGKAVAAALPACTVLFISRHLYFNHINLA
jgi:hypothetical protein